MPAGNISDVTANGEVTLETADGPIPYSEALAACRQAVSCCGCFLGRMTMRSARHWFRCFPSLVTAGRLPPGGALWQLRAEQGRVHQFRSLLGGQFPAMHRHGEQARTLLPCIA